MFETNSDDNFQNYFESLVEHGLEREISAWYKQYKMHLFEII